MDELYGWSFPVSTESLTGRIKTVSNEDLIRQSIEIILGTNPGERFYYPDFGCALSKYLFEAVNYTVLKRIEEEVRGSLEKWEKRISHLEVKAVSDRAERIYIDISYKITGKETVFYYRHNLDILDG